MVCLAVELVGSCVQLLEHKICFILKLRYSVDAIGFPGVSDWVKNLPAMEETWA